MKTDINSKEDIALLIHFFYNQALNDDLLKPIFDEFIHQELWNIHVNNIINFWSMVIFKNDDYSGNVFSKHKVMGLTKEQIDQWVSIFLESVNQLFSGTNAEEAKLRAVMLGNIFKSKINPDELNSYI